MTFKDYDEAIDNILTNWNYDLIIGSTGFISRILCEKSKIYQNKKFLYVSGSMGLSPSIGLGIALSNPNIKVLVINGDGATLMNYGTFFNIKTHFDKDNSLYKRLKIVVLRNNTYESVGNYEIGINFDFLDYYYQVYYEMFIKEKVSRKIERVGVSMENNVLQIREFLSATK